VARYAGNGKARGKIRRHELSTERKLRREGHLFFCRRQNHRPNERQRNAVQEITSEQLRLGSVPKRLIR
jgi:hypothetical protein